MKILKIKVVKNNTQGLFLNPTKITNGIPTDNDYQMIDQISKQDIFDILDFLLDNEIELDPYAENELLNPVQDIIYKNLYENFKSAIDSKDQIIKEIDDVFEDSEKTYTK